MGDENKDTNTPTLPAEGDVTISMDDLKKYLSEAIKGMTFPQVTELKEKMLQFERKALFPDGAGNQAETCQKSIIDTRFFVKDFASKQGFAGNDGAAYQPNLAGTGPFLKLSPTMEKFAEVLRYRANPTLLAGKGINLLDYNNEVREINNQYVKALTTTDAGALVPVEYLATIIEFATAQSPILQKVWRIPMGSLSMQIPKLVQSAGSYFGGIVLYRPNESEEKTATKPSFDTVTLTAAKLIALMHVTDELIADSSVNIINYLTAMLVRAFRYRIEQEIVRGTGANNQFLGIRNDPGVNVVARTTAGTVKYLDLINLESALDENFVDLDFLSRRATVNTLRKQVDTVGQPVYHDGFTTFLGGAMVPQLLGYPVHKTRNVNAMGVKGDLILGDLGYYLWGVRQEMTIDQSNAPRFIYDETTIRAVMRMDGKPGVSEAFAILDGTVS
jgi:HK97 family phage major capsid protein